MGGLRSGVSWTWTLFSVIVLTLGAGWTWISRASPGETTAGDVPAPRAGFLAPDFSLETSSGEIVQLSDLRGRPVLVNLWASWCVPCRTEMPALEEVYQAYRDQGFILLAVNATTQDSRQAAQAFSQEYELTFPILFDVEGSVSQQYQLRALPTSFFINTEGIIQEVVVGGPMSEALLRIRVEDLFRQGAEGSR